MKTALAAALAAVILTGCTCGLHEIKTSDADGTLCHYVGVRCCPKAEDSP